jgi:hypothetical protein
MAKRPRKVPPPVVEMAVEAITKNSLTEITANKAKRKVNPKSLANLQPWKPGQSGNPAGKPRSTTEMKQKAATYTDLALEVKAMTLQLAKLKLQRALEILTDPNNVPSAHDIEIATQAIDTAALGAAVAMLDRGHGKPQQKVEHDLSSVFDQMTDAEVEQYVIEKAGAMVTGMVARKRAAET